MKIPAVVAIVALAVLMTLGTASELSRTGPWFLHWLDIRWWWSVAATAWAWVSTYVHIDVNWPDGSGER